MSAESRSADLGDVRVSPSENDKNPAHFTPGPWSQNYVGTHGFIVRGGEKSVHVASVLPKQDFVESAEAKSNALLISAAPDLFSALSRLLLIAEMAGLDDEKSVVLARAALRKARGER